MFFAICLGVIEKKFLFNEAVGSGWFKPSKSKKCWAKYHCCRNMKEEKKTWFIFIC